MKATEHPGLARLFGLCGMLLLCVLLTAGVSGAQAGGGTYTNPVSKNLRSLRDGQVRPLPRLSSVMDRF